MRSASPSRSLFYTGGAVEDVRRGEAEARGADAQQNELAEAVKSGDARLAGRADAGAQVRAPGSRSPPRQTRQLASERYRLQLNNPRRLNAAEAAFTRAQTSKSTAQYDLELARAALDWATGETHRRYARAVKGP